MKLVIVLSFVGFCAAVVPNGNETAKKVYDAAVDLTASILKVDREVVEKIFSIVNENSPDESVMRSAITSVMKELGSKYSKVSNEISAKIEKNDLEKIQEFFKAHFGKC